MRAADSWEQQRQREMEEFSKHWNWDRVFHTWTDRLSDFSVSVEPLFLSIPIHDPGNPNGRPSALSWWPTDSVQVLQQECQRHLDQWPGTRGLIHPPSYYTRQGELDTLAYLWDAKGDMETTAAILFAASLFSRLESRRRQRPDNWPKYFCANILADWANSRWRGERSFDTWHPSCTDVLPYTSDDSVYKIETMEALVRYLAEEHASLLLKYRPVVIEYVSERDPFIARALREEYQAERQRQAEWREKQEKEKAENEEKMHRLKAEHPRWGEWSKITDDELQRLVWTKPTSLLAREFGVSDVAIGKRCKAAGISKPPLGFWRRVETGQIPHPNGKPHKVR